MEEIKEESVFKDQIKDLREDIHNTDIDSILADENIEEIPLPEPTDEEIEASIKTNLNEQYNLSEEDTIKVIDIINRVNNKEDINVYNELPQSMKSIIDKLCGAENITSNTIKKEFALDLINNIKYDSNVSLQIDAFNKAMKDINFEATVMSEYMESTRKYMEETILEQAKELDTKEDEDSKKGAKLLRELSAMYTKSYTYDYILEEFSKNRKMRNRTNTDLSRFNKYCNSFDLYMKSYTEYKTRPLKDCVTRIMSCNVDGITENDVKKFLTILCKYFDLKFYDHGEMEKALMYYTMNNLAMLNFSNSGKLTEFELIILDNVKKFIDAIHEAEEQKASK